MENMAAGIHPREMARRVYPNRDDRGKRINLYRKLKRIALNQPIVAKGISDEAKLSMMVALVPAAEALGARAARGRPDATKILFEASGFHNPRVQHEHSGEIKVKLEMPRPKFDSEGGHITDADVVDE